MDQVRLICRFFLLLALLFFFVSTTPAVASSVDGIRFGIEHNKFYFFDSSWGMNKATVKKILTEISGRQQTTMSTSLHSPTKNLEFFSMNGEVIDRDGIEFICIGKFNNRVIFYFEFENDKLLAIYVDQDFSRSSDYEKYNASLEMYRTITDLIPFKNHVSNIKYNNTSIDVRGSHGSFIASGGGLSYAIWPESTNMTIEKIVNVTSRIRSTHRQGISSQNTSKAKKNTATSQGSRPMDNLNNRIDFYRQNILTILN